VSPFKAIYGIDLLLPLNLVPRPIDERPSVDASKRVEEIWKLNKQAKARIEKSNMSYQAQANEHKKRVAFNQDTSFGFS